MEREQIYEEITEFLQRMTEKQLRLLLLLLSNMDI